MDDNPRLTWAEKAAVARLELKGARRIFAGAKSTPDIDRRVEAIYDQARKRANGSK